MNLSEPASMLLSSGDTKALAVLIRTTRPLSGREVACLGGGSPATTWRTLTRLAEHGLVHVQEVGGGTTLLYTLNREHLAADSAITLLSLRSRLIERLKSTFAAFTVQPIHASVFGSAARRDGNTGSDVDLLVVRPGGNFDEKAWDLQVERLTHAVFAWTGNRASTAEVTEQDVASMVAEKRPIVDELLADAVWLYGLPLRELLSGSGR